MIRKETPSDYQEISQLLMAAFKNDEHSDGSEHLLVERLRNSSAYIKDLSLVYEAEGKILGYILLTHIQIVNQVSKHSGLSLAPVAVLPPNQNKGIGSALIEKAHDIAASLNHPFIVLIGHQNYYPKFGYEIATDHDIRFPFKIPSENCMVKGLKENVLSGITGLVEYPKEFYK